MGALFVFPTCRAPRGISGLVFTVFPFLYHTGYSLVHLIITYFANFREGFQSKYKDNIKTYSEDALGVNHTKSEDEQ